MRVQVKPKQWVTLSGVRYGAGSILEVDEGIQDDRVEAIDCVPKVQPVVIPVAVEGGA